MARLDPLPIGAVPEVAEIFEKIKATGHYIPNSQPLGLKRLLAYVVARVHGCHY